MSAPPRMCGCSEGLVVFSRDESGWSCDTCGHRSLTATTKRPTEPECNGSKGDQA